ncbi:DUF4190 domain-containing protein [Luethyella okanaganae]|uniref:DUF4190 domain-containing protein n=1 Tax=Luethyella okanaganae TaxID=69372 RepID=A0ABW1VDS8_9MICO
MTYEQTPPAQPAPGMYPHPAYVVAAPPKNGYATTALVLGICGFVLMGIPFFIGWVLGGVPDTLAVIFGIIGINRAATLGGVGKGEAIAGLVLACVSLLSVLIGAGSIW